MSFSITTIVHITHTKGKVFSITSFNSAASIFRPSLFRLMLRYMILFCQQLKILYSVICFVFVFMMYYFISGKFTAYKLFHDRSMNIISFAINGMHKITIFCNSLSASIHCYFVRISGLAPSLVMFLTIPMSINGRITQLANIDPCFYKTSIGISYKFLSHSYIYNMKLKKIQQINSR